MLKEFIVNIKTVFVNGVNPFPKPVIRSNVAYTKELIDAIKMHPGSTISKLTDVLWVSRQAVSSHMKKLVDSGLVKSLVPSGSSERVFYYETLLLGQPLKVCGHCKKHRTPEGGVEFNQKTWICATCWKKS